MWSREVPPQVGERAGLSGPSDEKGIKVEEPRPRTNRINVSVRYGGMRAMQVTSCSRRLASELRSLLGFNEPCKTGPCLKISPSGFR